MDATLTGIYHYPVKSLAGIALQSCRATDKGLLNDREWMLVDPRGHFVSQRKYPAMALIQPEITENGLCLRHIRAGKRLSDMQVHAPGPEAPVITVKVWKDSCQARVCSRQVNEWLSRAIGAREALRLVVFDSTRQRLPGYPERFGANATRFADAAPFLVVNALSLSLLNLSLSQQNKPMVDIRHFRPNLVFSGLPGFAEHHLRALHHPRSGMRFVLVDPCQRCSVITVNPDTGENLPAATPFALLAEINPMPDKPKAPAFGMNARLENSEQSGEIHLGDKLEALFKYTSAS